ncbi:ABC transporter substrate-binding protein [Inmirania thermothiophila]|uniref:Amino acid/amide ABC transporter substrate-binding protein (HAAT family) n=1 Tax=Inmirania thermothiophila TaxID=1750597 RepID=A0A3N1Y0W3_9GAMM|nr:ABC transporter substrate-binding protein [Inmirania thermothiophila]ROR32466.1 amino acid/amide ABC transporter substrate-binding protein (HAAT family) [Inmirania thermothiophila]
MKKPAHPGVSRRRFLRNAAVLGGATAAATFVPTRYIIARPAKVKVGILLPYTGVYAKLGENIRDALMLRIRQNDGRLGGREVEFVDIDSQAKPPLAPELTNRLVHKEKVDFIVGAVHSLVGMAMAKIVGGDGPITVIANAGADQLTGSLCAPNIFRTSFSAYQTSFPCGKAVYEDGHREVVLMYWNYGFGKQAAAAFKEAFVARGGKIVKEIPTPFPEVEFQAYLTELAAIRPDAVFTFYAGGGAVKYVKDYAAAGLKDAIALYGAGFLTEGVLKAQGAAAEGVRTTLHYADTLDNPANRRFKRAFREATGRDADVYAVQGYDAGSLLVQGMAAVGGDTGARAELIRAMESTTIDSPRGPFTFSKAHNPIQDIYLREVQNGENRVLRIVAPRLEDPAKGCRMT